MQVRGRRGGRLAPVISDDKGASEKSRSSATNSGGSGRTTSLQVRRIVSGVRNQSRVSRQGAGSSSPRTSKDIKRSHQNVRDRFLWVAGSWLVWSISFIF